ncbi:MAG: aryl-sulfate sulfotransferase, partial [Candidatus Sumerlaeota bacterium]|nr:aryl-sulfate sulfotransferase [Candidatus Sumerlaeota bacterium]
MFIEGRIVTAPFRDQLRPGPLGVRKYAPHKCWRGYTLFSTAMGSTEYLIDMNGMVIQTWPITHSQYAELLPNGNLMADNYGSWLEEVNTAGERVWIWEGPCHHDFHYVSDDQIVFLINESVPPVRGFYPKEGEPKEMKSDTVLCMNRAGKVLWRFPFHEHIQELRDLAGLPLPARYAGIEADGKIVERDHRGASGHDWAHCNTIEVLPDTPVGRADKRFRQGNLLFSFRALDIIGVADVELNRIVWAWGLGTL